jgi:hypothetical protein
MFSMIILEPWIYASVFLLHDVSSKMLQIQYSMYQNVQKTEFRLQQTDRLIVNKYAVATIKVPIQDSIICIDR